MCSGRILRRSARRVARQSFPTASRAIVTHGLLYFIHVAHLDFPAIAMAPGLKKTSKRLSRETWLQRAMDIIAADGFAALNIDRLSRRLGVTKGSFYWHFENRKDFIFQMLEYWADISTDAPIRYTKQAEPYPAARLTLLMVVLQKQNTARYEVPIRAWAAFDPGVARFVRRVDRKRYAFVRSVFEGIGFSGRDLEVRVRAFVTYHSMEMAMIDRPSRAERMRMIPFLHKMFTQR